MLDDMPDRPKRTVRTHGTSGYRAGCRCSTCTLAESDRKRRFRSTGSGAKNVVAIRSKQDLTQPGEVERALDAETAELGTEHAVTVAQARVLARILDDAEMFGLHVQASRQLTQVLQSVWGNQSPGRGGRRKSGGRLAVVRELTKARRVP
jgi:hypothetical protein